LIAANLPALQVVIPLIGAPLCMLLGRGRIAWALSAAATWAGFAVAIALLVAVIEHGPISYTMGGWAPPWGIEYRVDYLSAFVLLIVSGIAAVVMPYAYHSVNSEIPESRQRLFYTAYLLTFAGLLGMAITGDAFNAFVFMEISSLSSYVLISLGRSRRALYAAFQYLVLGTIGATFFVIGVGLLYMVTGTLNMADMAERLAAQADSRVTLAAFGFLVVGLSLKLALFPLHLWLPNAYTYAPSMISALLAATGTKVMVYLLLRFMFTIYGGGLHLGVAPVYHVLMVLGLLAAVTGSLVAIFQDNIKRMLAYSSIAQLGYMALGISFASGTGITAATVHLFNHALMKGALFMVMGSVMLRCGGTTIAHLRGLGRRMPLTMAAFVIAGLSMIGVPGTVGFVSKWYLVQAALGSGFWPGVPVAVVVLAASLLAVIYIWRVVEAAYFADPDGGAGAIEEATWPMVAATWILAGGCVVFGLTTDLTVGVASRVATLLLTGAP
jgi:multicomponent Na+:H+ antiporter subunit D